MESIIYRDIPESWLSNVSPMASSTAGDRVINLSATAAEAQPLSPELFYPLVSESEMVTWTHWLPTTLTFTQEMVWSPDRLLNTLTQLNAPSTVREEFLWSWKMGLFEAYVVRTPARRDLHDPLLLGKRGSQYYRIALWGESLRPLEEIATLVQQSLAVRQCATGRRAWAAYSGTLLGFTFGMWVSTLPTYHGNALSAGVAFALLGLFFVAILWFLRTPENCQQDFLDRYRC